MADNRSEKRPRKAQKGAPRAPDPATRALPHETLTIDQALSSASFLVGRIKRKSGSYEIRTVRPGELLKVIALTNPAILETHWFFGRTVPHFLPPAACPCLEARMAIRLKGFFLAISPWGGTPFLCEVTENALLGWNPEPEKESLCLREITLRRIGSKPNGRLVMAVGDIAETTKGWKLPTIDIKRAVLEILMRKGPPIEIETDPPNQATHEGV